MCCDWCYCKIVLRNYRCGFGRQPWWKKSNRSKKVGGWTNSKIF